MKYTSDELADAVLYRDSSVTAQVPLWVLELLIEGIGSWDDLVKGAARGETALRDLDWDAEYFLLNESKEAAREAKKALAEQGIIEG